MSLIPYGKIGVAEGLIGVVTSLLSDARKYIQMYCVDLMDCGCTVI